MTAKPTIAAAADWLVIEGAGNGGLGGLLAGLGRALCDAGVPLARGRLYVRTPHPLLDATVLDWDAAADAIVEVPQFHGGFPTGPTASSPAADPLRGAGPELRWRRGRTGGSPPAPFAPVIDDTVTEVLGLTIGAGADRHAVIWATGRKGGFTAGHAAGLRRMARLMAGPLETLVTRQTAAVLMETYLGKRSGARVLDGEFRRGSGETIEAVLWLSDLRDFTPLSEKLPRDALIAVLNAHFERLGGPIRAFGGEVLKFIGDGIMAIFPVRDGNPAAAATAALNATRAARAGMAALNGEYRAAGHPALEFGIALHLGAVMYGNIGTPDRLDFTVVGPAVNLASRVEPLCKVLGCPVLTTEAFAHAAAVPLTSLGRHTLRGVDRPEEIFTLPEFAATAPGPAPA